MKRAAHAPETVADLVSRAAESLAVRKVRITTRGRYAIRDGAGDVLRGDGTALILVIDERMIGQGW